MKRYVSGMVTGTLMGAVMAGFWLLRRSRRPRLLKRARHLAPTAYRVAKFGGNRLVHLAKRRLS